jgi:hypothetical protein
LRFSKRFDIGERVRVQLLIEFFNVLNRQNPAAVQNRLDSPAASESTTFRNGRSGAAGTGRSGWFQDFVLIRGLRDFSKNRSPMIRLGFDKTL